MPDRMAATQKSSKKRPAPTQSGPTPKKVHIAKPAKGKDDKKRSRPVTLPVQEETSDSQEEEFDEFGGAEDDMRLDGGAGMDEMDVDSSNALPKDPNGMFQFLYGFSIPESHDLFWTMYLVAKSNTSTNTPHQPPANRTKPSEQSKHLAAPKNHTQPS
jgi:hypothetical protein